MQFHVVEPELLLFESNSHTLSTTRTHHVNKTDMGWVQIFHQQMVISPK